LPSAFFERSGAKEATEMVMPSILTLAIGAAVLVVLSALLRYLDNDALEQARTPRARASVLAKPRREPVPEGSLAGRAGSLANGKQSPLTQDAFEDLRAPVDELNSRADDDQVLDGAGDDDLARMRVRRYACANMHRDADDRAADKLAFARM
jgi:hypothetical protein